MEFDNAKKRFKEAVESGDYDAQTEAQVEISRATLNLDKVQNMRPLQVEENDVQIQQRSTTAPTTDRDNRWMSKNTWFGTDPEMTASALGLHQKLAKFDQSPLNQKHQLVHHIEFPYDTFLQLAV